MFLIITKIIVARTEQGKSSNSLLEIQLPLISNNDCAVSYANTTHSNDLFDDSVICGGYEMGGKGILIYN